MIEHLARGLRILGERWAAGPRAWITAGENWLDTGVRIGMVGGGGYVLWHLAAASWKLLGAVVLVVIVLALRAATKAAKGQPATPAKTVPAVAPASADGDPQGLPEAEFVALAHTLLDGAPGVHLATLADHLGTPWTIPLVRAYCQTHKIPVRPSVRDAARRVSPGLHRDDLPPLPEPLPEAAPVGAVADYTAGQPGTTGPTTPASTTPTTRRVGDLRITSTPDAANPHRTHVRVTGPARKGAR